MGIFDLTPVGKEEVLKMMFTNVFNDKVSVNDCSSGSGENSTSSLNITSSEATPTSVPFASPTKNSTPVAEDWSHLDVTVVKRRLSCTIPNFSDYYYEKKPISTDCKELPKYWTDGFDDMKWCLDIYPRGYDSRSRCYVSVFLLLRSSIAAGHVLARYKLSILDASQKETEIKDSHYMYKFAPGLSWGYSQFVRCDVLLNKANGLLSNNDELIIICEMSILKDMRDISGDLNSRVQLKVSEYNISEDVGNLFENPKFSDATLSVAGKDFLVHKTILAARSTVFAAMFEHEMEEKKRNRIVIADINHDVLKEMLRYIYTGKPQNIEKIAEELFSAAEKYDLKILKKMCEEELRSQMTVENVAHITIVADIYNAAQLKAHAFDFIISHATKVMDTSAWKNMISTHPHLINEVFRAVTEKVPRTTNASIICNQHTNYMKYFKQDYSHSQFYEFVCK